MSVLERQIAALKRGSRFVMEDNRSSVLLVVAAGWFLSIGVRMIYPVLLPYLRTGYDLDLSTAGLLLTMLWGAYAVGQLPGGVLTDRFGERTVLAGSTLTSALMLTLVVTAGSAVVLFATTALFGFATALYGVARYTAVSKVFPDRDGAAIGVTLAAGNLGNIILPASAGTIAAAFVWQFGLGLPIPVFILVAVLLWSLVPQIGEESTDHTFSMNTARHILAELRRPAVLLVAAVLVLGFGVWQTVTGFYPTYLIEVKGLSPTVATSLFSFFFGLAVIIQPLSGVIYDWLGIRRTLPLFLGTTIVGLVLLPLVDGTWPLIGVTVLLSCMTSTIAVTMPYLTDLLSKEIQGTALGILRTTYMLIGATAPALFGTLADLGHFDIGFFALATLVGMMLALVTLLPAHS